MGILNLVLLVALGLLGIASFIRSRNPQAAGPLAQLESIGGWIGLVGLVLGVLAIVQLILNIGVLMAVPITFILVLATAVAITALSLILAMPTLKTLLGASPFTLKLEALAAQLAGFKVILGAVCLGLAVWSLIVMF